MTGVVSFNFTLPWQLAYAISKVPNLLHYTAGIACVITVQPTELKASSVMLLNNRASRLGLLANNYNDPGTDGDIIHSRSA